MIAQPLEIPKSPFSNPRDFLDNRYVYLTISPRARGLSVGVNLSPDKHCNFDCVYCEVNRIVPGVDEPVDVEALTQELEEMLGVIESGGLQQIPQYRSLPANLLKLRHVAISGNGEPTLCPNFLDVLHSLLHLRALARSPFFKLVLITNSSNLDCEDVQQALQYFTSRDEIWAKLDAGTQEYMQRINRTEVPLEKVLSNILLTARKRPVVIQSLFALVAGEEPSIAEIDAYASRLDDLKRQGAQIQSVQIYSATRPMCHFECEHLPLRRLSQIAQTVRARTGLKVEIF